MAKKRLTSQFLNSNPSPGKYYDDSGTGLFINVGKSGTKGWGQKIRFGGKQQELGLGKYPYVSLAEARRLASENQALKAQGVNPKSQKTKVSVVPTFAELAEEFIPIKQKSLSNAKHREQWRSTIERYVLPKIGRLPVNEISIQHLERILSPIWEGKTETASRVRGRIEAILDYAIVNEFMSPPNPAAWKGNLSILLPQKPKISEENHHPALQVGDAQRWWAELKSRDGHGALALQMLTLCAARSNEIRGMRWDEIELFDRKKAEERGYHGIWTCPPERMKANRKHRVPLIEPMIRLLDKCQNSEGLVFSSTKNKPLSDMTLSAVMRRMNAEDAVGYVDLTSRRPAVPHGLRSTFRNWVAENGQSREAAELQLAHKFASKVEHAYYRTDLLLQRADLLRDWFCFLEGPDAMIK